MSSIQNHYTILNQAIPNYIDAASNLWKQVDLTKAAEQYQIDNNLQKLQFLSLGDLKKIFIQYRFFIVYYIADLATLVSKLSCGLLRTILAEILSDELGKGDPNKAHPKLYDDFLKSIGVTASDLSKSNKSVFKIYLQSVKV